MNDIGFSPSSCGLCAHYSPQGRRGGFCQKLDASVESKWDACPLFITPFSPTCNVTEEGKIDTLELLPELAGQEASPKRLNLAIQWCVNS